MDTRNEIREFLTSRRAKITPGQAGLPSYGGRRVPGLRREELAVMADVRVACSTRLKRGGMSGVSESVLSALGGALQLDEAERAHLFDLARAAQPTMSAPRRRMPRQRVRPAVQHILDAMTGAAAFPRNDRLDILGGNDFGYALYAPMFEDPIRRPVTTARFVFLDERARDFYLDWDAPPETRSPSCAPRRAATRTTATCQISSASSPRGASRSAPTGPRTRPFPRQRHRALPAPGRRPALPQLRAPGTGR